MALADARESLLLGRTEEGLAVLVLVVRDRKKGDASAGGESAKDANERGALVKRLLAPGVVLLRQ